MLGLKSASKTGRRMDSVRCLIHEAHSSDFPFHLTTQFSMSDEGGAGVAKFSAVRINARLKQGAADDKGSYV